MSMFFKSKKKNISSGFKFTFIFTIMIMWVYSGLPQVFNFPPEIEKAYAASPSVSSEGSAIDSNGGAFSITLSGTPASGDLYLVLVQSGDSAATWSQTGGTTGWTALYASSGGSIYYKQLTGSETPSFTSSVGSRSASTHLKIAGHSDPSAQAPEISATSTGTSNSPDPLIVTPTGGSNDYLYVAFTGCTDGRRTPNAAPSGFSTIIGVATGGGGGGGCAGHAYLAETSSSNNPGTFGLSGSAGWEARTVAVHPLAVISYEQSAYRLFENNNATSVVTTLAALNTAGTLTSSGQAFRLRMLMHVGDVELGISGENFKLQFAEQSGTCDTSFTGESYADVTGATVIAYNNNATPSDGDNLTSNGSDPTHGGDTIVNQDYEEANNFTNTVAAIPSGQDGKWDFSLYDNGASASTSYCFRVLTSAGAQLDTYTVVPEIITYTPTAYEQSVYRMFENTNTPDVGTALDAEDTAGTLTSTGQAFRLRAAIHVTGSELANSGGTFKLQFAEKSGTCDTSFTGESYADITGATVIAYNINLNPEDEDLLTGNANDPTHGSDTMINQSYEDSNNFTNLVSSIPVGEDGMWDFSLIDNGAPISTHYCFRMVESDGTLFTTYTVIPEIVTASPNYEQSVYRLFGSNDSTDVGAPLAAEDTAVTLTASFQNFRLRTAIHVTDVELATSGENFKLQFAQRSGTCDSSFVGESYNDVTSNSTMAFMVLTAPFTGDDLTGNVNDPTHGSDTMVDQDYVESNNFTNSVASIPIGDDGMWDFALVDNGSPPSLSYCFRMVESDGTLFTTYTVIPEITTSVTTFVAFEQSTYRIFENDDSADVGIDLESADTPATLTETGQAFRIRAAIHIINSDLATSGGFFRLQFAQRSGTCDSSFVGESYADVTGSTVIAFNDNATPSDGDNLTANANDPVHLTHNMVDQDYEESNTFTNSVAAIPNGDDGMWDFSLIDNEVTAATSYCFRMVKSDNDLFVVYNTIPEIATPIHSEFDQFIYRFFENDNSTSVGTPLAAEDTSASLTSSGEAFRLRVSVSVDFTDLAISGRSFKLQFAERSGTCDTSFVGESYTDVTGSTVIAYNNNATPSDGDPLSADPGDPPGLIQTYEEANDFTNSVESIPAGSNGIWDFALVDNGSPPSLSYCFRIVTSAGAQFDTYTVIPEILTAPPIQRQSVYRFFQNADSLDVGAVLAAEDTAATLASAGDAFRLRLGVHISGAEMPISGDTWSLQFAEQSGTCDTSFVGEIYINVTGATVIAFNDNTIPADGGTLTGNINDPTDGADTMIDQEYVESQNFSNSVAAIPIGDDGMWDFSLIDNGATANTSYCFRLSNISSGSLDTYTVIPEIITASSGTLSVDIVDSGGTPVGAPTVAMVNEVFDFDFQTATGTFGTNDQRIRVDNGTGSDTWTLSLAASATTAVWDSAGTDYDFNDATASAGDGGDTDSLGGQMTVDPSVYTIAPEGGCTDPDLNIAAGSSTAFKETATAVTDITIAQASSGADTGCYWDITGVSLSQTIPAEQPVQTDYTIDFVLSIVAI